MIDSRAVLVLAFWCSSTVEVAAAQAETVVATAPGRESRCQFGAWELSAPEIVAPRQPFFVRFEGPAGPMPETIAITLRGPSGTARRTAVYEPDEQEPPICDSVGPRPCGPRGARTESFGVVFDAGALSSEGDHRLEVGAPGHRPTCHVVVHVSRALARVYVTHGAAQNTALFARSHRTNTWQLVRGPLDGSRSYEHARAVIGDSPNALEVDVVEGVDSAELAAYLGRLRHASFDAVLDANVGGPEEVPAHPDDLGERSLLAYVFHSEALLYLSVSGEGFEIAWQVSAAILPGRQAIVRIRGRALGRSEREVVASYLGALHPSLPPSLP